MNETTTLKIGNESFERAEQFRYLGKRFQIKILFRKKLRSDWSHVILATIRCRFFCLPVCYPKTQTLNIH